MQRIIPYRAPATEALNHKESYIQDPTALGIYIVSMVYTVIHNSVIDGDEIVCAGGRNSSRAIRGARLAIGECKL